MTIAPRFCGPPGVANGGYLSGRLAALVGADTVTARLRRPTPLGRSLELRADGSGLELLDGTELLASAAPGELDLDVPEPPSLAEARAAAAAFPPRTGHHFPRCFGCGPARVPGDAVCALVGPLPDRPELWAGTFQPSAELPSAEGMAAPETVWAALDCPSYQPVAPDDRTPHLLGTMTVRQERPVRLDVEHVLIAWLMGREGRRAISASAVVDPDGRVCARAQAVWIAVPPSAA